MKNVMTKAWEIAKKGQKKFGGKVKEYFAEALRMAWAIIKKGVEKVEIGYKEYATKNGVRYFLTNDVDGLKVSFLRKKLNGFTGKEFIKKIDMTNGYKRVQNKKTGEIFRLYDIEWNYADVEIELNDQVEFVKNSR